MTQSLLLFPSQSAIGYGATQILKNSRLQPPFSTRYRPSIDIGREPCYLFQSSGYRSSFLLTLQHTLPRGWLVNLKRRAILHSSKLIVTKRTDAFLDTPELEKKRLRAISAIIAQHTHRCQLIQYDVLYTSSLPISFVDFPQLPCPDIENISLMDLQTFPPFYVLPRKK
jgi:hypothetical protein